MSSRLLVNLIDPSEIVVPDTDGVPDAGAPDTGMLSIGKWLDEAFNNNTALFIAIGLIVLVVVAIIVLLIRRRKKQSSINGFGGYAPMKLGAQKYLVPKLAGLSFIILVSVFGILKFNDNQRMASAEAVDGPSLTVTTEDITAIDIEMEDEAVFGVGESKVKVTTATDTGYTLMAYVDSTSADLTNDSNDAITMLETSQSQALTDNTWGIALSRPNSQDEIKFRGLPTAEKDAMVVKVSGSDATEANDETTLYYGAYVTPDLDYGTYEGVTINYIAVAHVTDGDVTVNFHGNGYYFDQAGTKDVNTVVYGTSCELAYVGGNCSKVYTTEQPEIVKTPNIRDDGTQSGPYPISERDSQSGRYLPTVNKIVSIPGADALRVEIDYAFAGESYTDIIFGAVDDIYDYDGWYYNGEYEQIYTYESQKNTQTFMVLGDAITIVNWTYGEPIEGYNYGFYAKVYPVFYQKPSNIETIEDAYCHFAKSDNLDDEGGMMEPYVGYYAQSVTLPRADKIKIEIEYALTDEAWIGIFEGQFDGGPILNLPIYEITTWDEESDTGSNISGRETFVVDGDTLTFMMESYDEPVSGYNYGFYARLYPIYDDEQEDTIPERVCSFANKSGEYSLPVGYGNNGSVQPKRIWYNVIDDDGYLISGKWFRDEEELKSAIVYYYDEYAGKTIDLYLFNDYSIRYDSNGGNGSMSNQRVLPHTNANIYSNEFTNAGYEFIGWNTRSDGTGTWYQPDDIVLDLVQPGETITLYAQWEIAIDCNPGATTIGGAVCMQDFAGPNSEQIVGSMTPETQYTLVDGRDGKSYTITKILLGDEYEVWMTQNLDLDIRSQKTYTNENTDIGYNSNTQQYETATWKPARSTYSTGDSTWEHSDSTPESYDPGDLCWNGAISPDYYGTLDDYAGACGNEKHYHIGNYYNFTAAIAMNDSSSYTANHTDVNQSICPAGWRLPALSGSRSYDGLVTEYDLTSGVSGNIQNAPLYFVYGGGWDPAWSIASGGLGTTGTGSSGSYWPSSIYRDSGAWGFSFTRGGTMDVGVEFHRYAGGSVRCVARTGEAGPSISISDLTYMQDFATLTSEEKTGVLASMPRGRQYQLKDNRDEKTYYISKLADGNVWMTQNLDHDIVARADYYTSANTDIPSTWTPSVATYATNDTTWHNTTAEPQSYDPGDLCWNGVLGYYDITTGTTVCGDNRHMHIGNYYNWTAAIAMNSSDNYITDGADTGQSICPAGWQLPIRSGNKSYSNLVETLGLTSGTSGNIQNSPAYFVYSGDWWGSSDGVGRYGHYWSSVVHDNIYIYRLFFNHTNYTDPQYNGDRRIGFSVRCVAR